MLEGGGADVEMWSLMTIDGTPLVLWIVAGMVRLWVYPFHLSAPDDLVEVPPLGIPLLLSPILGWGLWLRIIAVTDSSVLEPTGVSALAAGTLALGGLLAWSCESPRRLLPWIGMAANGAILLGTGFAGFTVSAALGTGSAAVTQGASFIFFPLTFLAPTFVPLELLDGWLKTAAQLNPITYVLGAMRELINSGWNAPLIWQGVFACLLLALVTYALAALALRVRTRRT